MVTVGSRPNLSDSQPTAMMPTTDSMPVMPKAPAAISGLKPCSTRYATECGSTL